MIAGFVWIAVSLGLATAAAIWLLRLKINVAFDTMLAAAGLLGGSLWYKLMFQKLVVENIDRIETLAPHKEKVCVFAFQNIRSYFIVLVMMTLGYLLRTSGLTKEVLAPLYLAIGVALFLGSLRYFNHLRLRRIETN